MTIFILYTILYLITTIGIFIVAALVFLRQRNRTNKAFALFTFFLGVWVLLQFVAQFLFGVAPFIANLAFQLTLTLPAFFAVEFYHFALSYSGKLSTAKRARWRDYVIPAALAIAAFVPGFLYSDVTLSYAGIVVSATAAYYVLLLFVIIYIGLGIRQLVLYMRHNVSRDAHYRTRFLLFGVGAATVIILGAILFLPDLVISQLSIPLGVLAMVSFIGYAIVKHRLFDIRLIAVRLLAYSLSLLTVALLYTLLTFGLFAGFLGSGGTSIGQQLGFVAVAMVLAVTFGPLKRFFDRATRAIFYQDAYDARQVIDDIGTVLVRKVEARALVKDSLTILRTALKSEHITVILLDSASGGVDRTIGVGKAVKITEAFAEIVRAKSPLLVTDELEAQSTGAYHALQRAGISAVVNLRTSKELIGYVAYGYKANGRIYSNDDLNLVRLTADELAVAIQNALRFEEIAGFNQTLQHEVKQATLDLRESNKKLKSLDEAKDEFISMASHQLRTPLTSVKGYLSMVLEGDAGELSPSQVQLLEQAFASSQRMVYLISDFLNVSRLQTGKFTIERTPTMLNRIVKEEADQLRSTASSRELTINCHVPSDLPMMLLDESKIRQVVMNFIDNAIFYSKAGGSIDVDLVKTGRDLQLTVRDQGIGVPASERHHLFTKFYRASNARTARPDGTGIGLFMAKKVVVALGGSIIFTSVEGKGSTFGFRLPLGLAAKDQPEKFKE